MQFLRLRSFNQFFQGHPRHFLVKRLLYSVVSVLYNIVVIGFTVNLLLFFVDPSLGFRRPHICYAVLSEIQFDQLGLVFFNLDL